MIVWSLGRPVSKRIFIGPPEGSGVRECTGWVFGGLGGRPDSQRCRNQGYWLMRTDTPALEDEIFC